MSIKIEKNVKNCNEKRQLEIFVIAPARIFPRLGLALGGSFPSPHLHFDKAAILEQGKLRHYDVVYRSSD